MDELKDIIQKQENFQRFLGWPIDSNLEEDRNRLFEIFIFKLIEEAIELRKESPSVMNPWSKKQKEANHLRIKEEMSDVFLFFVNLMITWKLPLDEFFEAVHAVQANNVLRIKEKKMKMLNERITNIPGYTTTVGRGSLNPLTVFVVKKQSNYFGFIEEFEYQTQIVKCDLFGDREPTQDEIDFWTPSFNEEIEILKEGNPNMKIVYV